MRFAAHTLAVSCLGLGLGLGGWPDGAAADADPPVVEFMGSRFIILRGEGLAGFGGIGFDPVNRRILSEGITDECGELVDPDPMPDSGISWDPVNEEFWLINGQRQVYRYDGANQELIFEIPEVFDVPGVGPDTLESPQGLALDDGFVYVVDFGPEPGEVWSNAWFKFTRDGTPVSSSKATDFVANLDAAPDALVDGITWVPPTSPFAPGLFLVALEHSGIMVLDADGFFVDELLWVDAGLQYGGPLVPFAFAGITIDPRHGDLYLLENDGSGSELVWIRLPEEDPQTLIYGNPLVDTPLHHPTRLCSRPLPRPSFPGSNGLTFGLTYRNVDGLLWTINYNTGEAFTVDPQTGEGESRGQTDVPGIWGLAYDTDRDVIYLYEQSQNRVLTMDPSTLHIDLPPEVVGTDFAGNDIAFNSDDSHIYTLTTHEGEQALTRIDRDTGAGTVVGPVSIFIGGLTYDPTIQRLIALGRSPAARLFTIDPVTADIELLTELGDSATTSWEGLAAIPTTQSTVAVGGLGSTRPPIVLRAIPNPLTSRTRVVFDHVGDGVVDAQVFDVAGRTVRHLQGGTRVAGVRMLEWDGQDDGGRSVAAGAYFIRIVTASGSSTVRVSVLR